MTWDNGTLKFYLNGTQQSSTDTYTPGFNLHANMAWGASPSETNCINGFLDDCWILDYALTATEVANLQNDTAAFNGIWTDIYADTLGSTPLRMLRGIRGSRPTDRVAQTGTMSFALNNSANNSGSLLGLYSPDHTNAKRGFEVGMKTRLKFTYSGSPYYKYRGKVSEITPSAGQYLDRSTRVQCVDWMDDAAKHKISGIAVQTNQTGDQLVTTAVGNMAVSPNSTSYGSGLDTYAYAFHTSRDEKTTVLNIFQKTALSGMDNVFVRGNSTTGEVLVYQTRHDRVKETTSQVTLNDTMIKLRVKRPINLVYNKINIVTYPTEVDADATTVLATLQKELSLNAGASHTMTMRYRDPSGAATRVSGTAMVTPVADTDYKMSSVSGDGGNDLNDDLGVSVTFGGNTASITLTNNHASSVGYVNLFQLRGKGIYLYDPSEYIASDSTSQSDYGVRPLSYNMPYQDDPNVGVDFGDVLLDWYKDPVSYAEYVEFIANKNDTLMTAALGVEIGELVTITETLTGINTNYFVNAIDLRIQGKNTITCGWHLFRAADVQWWVLGDASLGKLGDTTILGF